MASRSRRLDLPPAGRRPKARPKDDARLRRDGRHCPVCVERLPRLAGDGGYGQKCVHCGAQPSPERRCAKCAEAAVWESGSLAACASCGAHGRRLLVIAGAHEER
jgi:hypothetical protein